jgi:two-component system alkaline phosphatase synthesis response regulator PhoP
MKTILVVDDEPEIIRITRGYLEQAGFRVLNASSGSSALHTFRADKPDLVVLDINLPTPKGSPPLDGLDVARAIRQMPGTAAAIPIILLTARVDEIDRILGLELGADDYITKPFSPRELVARVRAVLRRGRLLDEEPERILAGDLVIDTATYSVTRDNETIELTPTEFTLLQNLAAVPGRVFSREQLWDTLGPDYEGLARTIDSHIKNLRAKIEPDPRQPELILTVFGRGYKFNEQQ